MSLGMFFAVLALGVIAGFNICWDFKDDIRLLIHGVKADEVELDNIHQAARKLYDIAWSDGFTAKSEVFNLDPAVKSEQYDQAFRIFLDNLLDEEKPV